MATILWRNHTVVLPSHSVVLQNVVDREDRMNNSDKQRLTDFVLRRLPDLLRANGGKLRKNEARQIVRKEFANAQNGWPASLDEKDANGPLWTNAWGHALRRLSVSRITEPCARKGGTQPDYYRLRGVS
jgi:hypothetical protein